MGDKIPKIVNAAKEQPLHSSEDSDSGTSGAHIAEGRTKMMGAAGLPHKHTGDRMPHEHFHDKMTDKLCY